MSDEAKKDFVEFCKKHHPDVATNIHSTTPYPEAVELLSLDLQTGMLSDPDEFSRRQHRKGSTTVTQVATKPGSFQVGSISGDVNISK
jgi:hypothetical protein